MVEPGGAEVAGLISFSTSLAAPSDERLQKGQKKIEGTGRKPGQRNRLTTDMKEALLAAATNVGFVREEDLLDKDGKSTGKTELKWDGDGGLEGYLEWAAVYHPGHFITQLGRVMPLQINVKSETKPKRVPYRSYADLCAALRAKGIDPEVMERAMMPKFITDQRPVIDGEAEDDAKPN